ncbi:hypothetical protein PI125_g9385 [Phytophthora idaei]|nr:hypothetical protein PI125_g9385 [Phytophthora idaei]KAG3156656.1 hypothetical protein PI126_g8686 [Phytophthora idaei]
MVRRPPPTHYTIAKAAADATWSLSDLATWATQEFTMATPETRSTVRGIPKRKHEFDEVLRLT